MRGILLLISRFLNLNCQICENFTYYQDALLKAGKEILRVSNYDVLYMLNAYDEVNEHDPLRGSCLLEAA